MRSLNGVAGVEELQEGSWMSGHSPQSINDRVWYADHIVQGIGYIIWYTGCRTQYSVYGKKCTGGGKAKKVDLIV